jgi:ABC-type dipeptide/oligopeptide/nickel transport system permease subunit
MNLDDQFLEPSAEHWFGTDRFGRDLFTRVVYGARISLLVGLVPSVITVFLGGFLGVLSGYAGGRTDFLIMRLADVVMAFPSLLLALVVMYTLGASLFNIFIALSLVGWAGVARVVRSQVLSLKEMEFVEAARAIGVRDTVIMARHIFPNCLPVLIVLFTLRIPEAIMFEASLSFLGVGAQPPTPSWGLLVSRGKEFLFSAPWVAILPGVAIFVTVLAFNFMGDGFRDAIDPYMKD